MGLIRSASGVTTLKIFKALIGFLGVLFLTRITSQTTLGQYFLYAAVVTLASVLASAGVNGATEKRISEGQPAGEVYTGSIGIKGVAVLVTVLGLLLFRSHINSYMGFDGVALVAFGILARESSMLVRRVLRGENRVLLAVGLGTLQLMTFYVVGTTALLLDIGVIGLIYGFITSHVLVTGLAVWFQQTRPGDLTVERCRSIIDYAKSNIITSVGGIIYKKLDIVLLGVFVAPSAIAAYEVAWRLSSVGVIFAQSISITLFPKISAWYSDEQIEKIREAVNSALVPSLGFVIPIWIGGTLLNADLLTVLYGEAYAVASLSLSIILFERILRAGNKTISRCLSAVDRPDLAATATVISIITNVVLNLLLIPQFGIAGAAIGTSVSFGLKLVIEGVYLQRIVAIKYPIREIVWMFTAACIMGLVVEFAKQYIIPRQMLGLFMLIALGGASYLGVLAISKDIRQFGRVLFGEIIS